jgi:Icc-related predicted phosphoesterase
MKIRLISDLHIDHDSDGGIGYIDSLPVDADVLVVAGDVANSIQRAIEALMAICARWSPRPVLYVPGNHEYYSGGNTGCNLLGLDDLCRAASNLHPLNLRSVTIDNRTFHGATLWYPKPVSYNWSDFTHINGLAYWIEDAWRDSREFLKTNVKKGDIVVTHTLPSTACVAPRYAGDPDNRYFVGHCDDIILKQQPAYWLFGHTHDSNTLRVEETLCISAPRGYPSEHNNTYTSPFGRLICM